MGCIVHVPPTPWPPAIRHNTLRMEFSVGKFLVRDHDWVILPLTYALTPDHNIQAVGSVGVHDSYVDEFGRSAVMEFQLATTFPDCSFREEPPFFYQTALTYHGTAKLNFVVTPYGPEAHDHGNLLWPKNKPLDEGTWGLWLESEVHFRFDVNTDIDWHPLAFIQVYAHHTPKLVTVPTPQRPIEGTNIFDTAVLSGCIRPTGFITFQLYKDDAGLVFSSTVPVDGNGSYQSTPKYTVPPLVGDGHYHWLTSYSGDALNDPLASDPEPFVVEPLIVHVSATDQWEPRDISFKERYPGLAKFKKSTPGHEEWFVRT